MDLYIINIKNKGIIMGELDKLLKDMVKNPSKITKSRILKLDEMEQELFWEMWEETTKRNRDTFAKLIKD